MTTLKIVWAWAKKYWFLLLAFVGFIVGVIFMRRGDIDLSKLLEQINDDHKKDLESIKNKEQAIAEGKAVIKEEEARRLEELDKKYAEIQKDLDAEQQRRAEEILKETDADPDELARRLAELTGSKKLGN